MKQLQFDKVDHGLIRGEDCVFLAAVRRRLAAEGRLDRRSVPDLPLVLGERDAALGVSPLGPSRCLTGGRIRCRVYF